LGGVQVLAVERRGSRGRRRANPSLARQQFTLTIKARQLTPTRASTGNVRYPTHSAGPHAKPIAG